jgi:hypothetical protein
MRDPRAQTRLPPKPPVRPRPCSPMDHLSVHPYYDLLEPKVHHYLHTQDFQRGLEVNDLLNLLHITDLQTFTKRASYPNPENEIRSLAVALFAIKEMESMENEVHPIDSVQELKSIFLREAYVEDLLAENNLDGQKSPFNSITNSDASCEEEWQSLLDFANYLKYCALILHQPPNKVISMKAAALLTGYTKCLEGKWAALGGEIRRRHLIFHGITGVKRRKRSRNPKDQSSPRRRSPPQSNCKIQPLSNASMSLPNNHRTNFTNGMVSSVPAHDFLRLSDPDDLYTVRAHPLIRIDSDSENSSQENMPVQLALHAEETPSSLEYTNTTNATANRTTTSSRRGRRTTKNRTTANSSTNISYGFTVGRHESELERTTVNPLTDFHQIDSETSEELNQNQNEPWNLFDEPLWK